MDFMVPVGVRMDGSMRLPDEVGIPLNGRKGLYGEKVRSVILYESRSAGRKKQRLKLSSTEKLWVTRGERWVPTVSEGLGRIRYLVISNVGEEILRLDHRLDVGMILDQDKVPRSPWFVSVGSHRYREWQKLALESTVDTRSGPPEFMEGPVEPTDHQSRSRARIADANQIEAEFLDPERGRPSTPTTSPDADRYLSGDAERGGISESMPDQATDRTDTNDARTENQTDVGHTEPKTGNLNCQTQIKLVTGKVSGVKSPIHPPEVVDLRDPLAATTPQDAEDEDGIYSHESDDLSAEELEGNLAVLPEIPISTTAIVSIEDLQVGDSGSATPEEIERLRQIIWKKRHLLIGKENALPPAVKDVVYDFDGLLAAEIIRPSTSPWASPIVIVRKSNGVDIRLCIDYKLVNNLTRLMVYPMPLITDLLEVLDEALWYSKSFWGMDKVVYLGHRVSTGGLEANPKDLKSLTDLPFPGSLRSMQSFLGSLNYCSRFIEDYAIYASVLYELRKVKFAEVEKRSDLREIMDRNDPILQDLGPPELKWTEPVDERVDSLASAALQRQGGIEVQKMPGYQDPVTLNRLDEILIPRAENPVLRVVAVTTRGAQVRSPTAVMQEDMIREMPVDRIKQAQEAEVWIAGMKKYLSGSIADLTQAEARSYGKIAADYEVDEQDLLFYCPPTPRSRDDRDQLLRLVVPETLQSESYTTITLRKGKLVFRGESLGNLQATYPFQIIAMDHIPSLPKSHKGNTELLIWVDLFTGYVIAKASSSRSAQTVAESYEECAFRRFGAREMIRHDREPGFMSDFVRSFNKILGQRQRATMAYQPQANGTAERMVQTATRALQMYVRDLDQKDWDEYAERLTFAINTAHDRIRGDTPHYLVHGWDPRSTLEATLPIGYRAGRHNEDIGSHQKAESRIWLYLDRVKEGYERKLAHATGTGYQIFPVVHVAKLKVVKDFPDRPRVELTVDETDRLDFDEILLPEDSWVPDLGADEYEVERISDMRSGKKTRFGRIYRELLVHWAVYYEPTWVDEADLNSFLRERANRNLYNVMQSHEKM
ncbi:reverse transcriptase, partial [Phytophthora megakarya]